MWTGLVAFIFGAVVLLQKFDVIPDTTWGYLWPSVLVVVGLKLMVGSCESCESCGSCDIQTPKNISKKKRK